MVVITTFRPPESPVRLEQRNITVVLDKKNLGTGTLFVSEKFVTLIITIEYVHLIQILGH